MCCDLCSISITNTVCTNNCRYTKDTKQEDLQVGDSFEISGGYSIKVLDIHDAYVTISISNDSIVIIRNFFLNSLIPICLNEKCFNALVKIQVTNIST